MAGVGATGWQFGHGHRACSDGGVEFGGCHGLGCDRMEGAPVGGGGSPALAIRGGIAPTVTLPAAGIVIIGGHAVIMLAVVFITPGIGGVVGLAVSEGSGCHGQVVWLMC